MNKPKAIQWLERETGEEIEYPINTGRGKSRHLSIRLEVDLLEKLNKVSRSRGETPSQTVRMLIEHAVREQESVAGLDDAALAVQLNLAVSEVTRRLAG